MLNNFRQKNVAIEPSISDYEDKEQSVTLKRYLIHKIQGYNYYILEEESVIRASVVLDSKLNISETVTELDEYCFIRSKTQLIQLDTEDEIQYCFTYADGFYGIFSKESYNKQEDNYIYTAQRIYPKNERFFYDTAPVNFENIPNNSTGKWLQVQLPYAVYFAYNTPKNINTPYISVTIKDTQANTSYGVENGVIRSFQKDEVTITLYNIPLYQKAYITEYIYNIILNQPELEMSCRGPSFQFDVINNEKQDGFQVKTDIASVDIGVWYWIEYSDQPTEKIIRKATVDITYKE